MEGVLRTLRWTLAIRALLAIAIGVSGLHRPHDIDRWLMPAFGGYATIEGLLVLAAAGVLRWPALLLQALVSLAAGVLMLASPVWLATFGALPIGAWGATTGLLQTLAAFRLRELFRGEWLMAASGLVTATAGAALIAATLRIGGVLVPPAVAGSAASEAWLISTWALTSGVIMLGLVWRLSRISVRM